MKNISAINFMHYQNIIHQTKIQETKVIKKSFKINYEKKKKKIANQKKSSKNI